MKAGHQVGSIGGKGWAVFALRAYVHKAQGAIRLF
jgi:hypothetical protein